MGLARGPSCAQVRLAWRQIRAPTLGAGMSLLVLRCDRCAPSPLLWHSEGTADHAGRVWRDFLRFRICSMTPGSHKPQFDILPDSDLGLPGVDLQMAIWINLKHLPAGYGDSLTDLCACCSR